MSNWVEFEIIVELILLGTEEDIEVLLDNTVFAWVLAISVVLSKHFFGFFKIHEVWILATSLKVFEK